LVCYPFSPMVDTDSKCEGISMYPYYIFIFRHSIRISNCCYCLLHPFRKLRCNNFFQKSNDVNFDQVLIKSCQHLPCEALWLEARLDEALWCCVLKLEAPPHLVVVALWGRSCVCVCLCVCPSSLEVVTCCLPFQWKDKLLASLLCDETKISLLSAPWAFQLSSPQNDSGKPAISSECHCNLGYTHEKGPSVPCLTLQICLQIIEIEMSIRGYYTEISWWCTIVIPN
jgi:hypothetical protein